MDVLSGVILGGAALSGGIGTVVGTLLGSMTIGVINNGLNLLNVNSYYQEIVKGIIIILAVVIKRNKGTK
jgi:ribose transport system permease protein